MNERLVLVSANRILNENIMMHDQSKIFSNEFYHTEARYGIDDGMIDELMISGNEALGDLTHLENTLNKNSNLSVNMVPLTSEDYFNQFAFNQVTNIMNNNNNNNSTSQNTNNNQYTYHTLQSPQIQNNPNFNNQLMTSNQNNINNYMSIGSASSTSTSYNNKIVNRTPSYNSSLCGSSSSSPSSLLSTSNSSLNNLASNNNNQNAVSSSTNESFDYDNAGTPSNGPSTGAAAVVAANDPAELARQKQMRGLTLTPEELQLLAKDRQRKDNHNMIERRRRFNINDRIKELGQLLPKNGEYDAKQNKGSILKASVDYILKIRSENDEYKKTLEANKYFISLNKKLYNRIKELEILCRSNGISIMNQANQNNNNNNFNQSNENFSTFNSNNVSHELSTEFEANKNNYNNNNKSEESNHIIHSENISVEGCLPSGLIYNENLGYQQSATTNNTNNNEPILTNINFNQLNNNSTTMTVKKATKNETKKRTHSTINNGESSSSNSNSNNESSKKINKSENKTLKEEPISPKNSAQQIMLKSLDQPQLLENNNYLNPSIDQFDQQNQSSKYSKTTANNPRFVFTSKLMNRASQICETASDQKEATLTSSSKDPTLASSSISSPSSPSSSSCSSSSNSSSSNSSSLCHT